MRELLINFSGYIYMLPENWYNYVDINYYKNRPINYLEIGTSYGSNLIAAAKSYGNHPDSKLYCIDPWEEFPGWRDYPGSTVYEQSKIYDTFINNLNNSGVKDKITINRGYSNNEILKFNDDFFDIIYIDGNHEPEYVLEDAVLSFRKLKTNGVMIFDDYGYGGPDLTKKGIDAFVSGYHKRVKVLGEQNNQLFVIKNN